MSRVAIKVSFNLEYLLAEHVVAFRCCSDTLGVVRDRNFPLVPFDTLHTLIQGLGFE